MEQIRLLKEDEYESAIRLADQVFLRTSRNSMGRAFPQIFSSALCQSYGVFDNEQLVSFFGLVPHVLHIGPSRIHAYSIGSVCTHPDYRGRGYASKALEQIHRHGVGAGASVMFISGSGGIYEKAECHPFGTVHSFQLHAEPVKLLVEEIGASSSRLRVRYSNSMDLFKIHQLLVSREVYYEQSIWDLALLLEAQGRAKGIHANQRVKLAEDEHGQLRALAVIGFPESDAKLTVIEYAGDEEALMLLFSDALRDSGLQQLVVPVPFHDKKMISKLQRYPWQKTPSLGTLHLFNPQRLIEQLGPWFKEQEQLSGADLQVQMTEDGNVEMSVNEHKVVLSKKETIEMWFNQDSEICSKLNLPEGDKRAVQALFPVPLPYPGGLNYI